MWPDRKPKPREKKEAPSAGEVSTASLGGQKRSLRAWPTPTGGEEDEPGLPSIHDMPLPARPLPEAGSEEDLHVPMPNRNGEEPSKVWFCHLI